MVRLRPRLSLLLRFLGPPTIRPAMAGSRRTTALVVLALLALSLRLGVVAALWSDHAAPLSYEHGRIAENLLNGNGFSIEFLGAPARPTSQQAPFYPFLLAGIYACFGVETPASILAVQLLQCLAGTALVLAVVWLVWSLVPGSPATGWIAGIGAAVYPTHLYMVTHLQVALWAALGLTLLLAVIASPRFRATWRGAVLAGLLAGLLLLIEPILALALPICALAFWITDVRLNRHWGASIARAASMAAVAAIVIGPWIARNGNVHGRFVFVKSTFGYAPVARQQSHQLGHGQDSQSECRDPATRPRRIARRHGPSPLGSPARDNLHR